MDFLNQRINVNYEWKTIITNTLIYYKLLANINY